MQGTGHTVEAIQPGVWAIHQGMVRSFLVVGDMRALLIDTGIGQTNLREVVDGLMALPCAVVNTHGHRDHTGGNAGFCEIYIHALDLPMLQSQGGTAETIAEGDLFQLGGRTLAVMALPGHTPGSIGLWDVKNETLYAGDMVALDRPIFMCFPDTSFEDFLRSMDRIEHMNPQHIYCAHGTMEADLDCVRDLKVLTQQVMRGEVKKEPAKPLMPYLADDILIACYARVSMLLK